MLCLRTMLMLELVSPYLGPNCLDLWNPNFQSVIAHGLLWCDSCHGLCCDVCKAGIDREIWVHQVNRKFGFDRNSNRGFYCS